MVSRKKKINEESNEENTGESLSFETALEKLEGLVEKLEKGNLTLDESLETFEQGMGFARVCTQKLSKAESRIEQLVLENGELRTKPFTEG
ncbi:exodeoxyribonuclease VII small subunit [uncultured Methanomethylovorans sp.]|uniref:exodeoxyribonuclease VII small subunit n=1 Tax=uncultured Methanomethylovorans sp. TaxID=183759 RepID=UPI002AA60A65|nr:exodeoxyribonuclease VII small subunit [uncultured Methanomethylovorans sp.]